jgi:quercetin dioxygenase-like cupin family protein
VQLVRWDEVPTENVNETTALQVVWSPKATLARFSFAKGAYVDPHKHEAEQHTALVRGAMTVRLEGQDVTLFPGDVLIIDSWTQHEVWFLEDSIVLDFFAPAREDWRKGERDYLRGARCQALPAK